MVIFGIVLIVVAIVLIIVHVMSRKKIATLLIAHEQTTSELKETADALTKEIGDGGFKEMASVHGQARCNEPLMSPIGHKPCLYYESTVVHEYEEPYERRDSEGHVHRETRRGSETMSSQHQGCTFTIDDGHGELEVSYDNASYDTLTETVNRFEPGQQTSSKSLLVELGLSLISPHGTRRTLGYRYTEKILPITTITAIGEVRSEGGKLIIGKGAEHPFILSTRTREEQLGSAKSSAKGTSIASGICFALGVILTIVGLF